MNFQNLIHVNSFFLREPLRVPSRFYPFSICAIYYPFVKIGGTGISITIRKTQV